MARLARGKPVAAANLHLTLAFLGEVEETRVELLAGIAGAIGSPGFTLELDRVGSFPRAHVAWAGCSRPAAALLQLQADLAAGLAAQGFALEERPFAPHLTLARKTSAPVVRTSIAPIAWRASELALVRSRAGRYETLSSWRLV